MLLNQITPIGLFVVEVPGIDTIGMFTRCSGLALHVDVLQYVEGGNNDFVHQLPGQVSYPNLRLTRGLTNDDALFRWFKSTRTDPELKEVILTFQTHTHVPVRIFTFANAFPVRWTGPDSEAGSSTIALETLEIAHGGLQDL
jgi:phage tail-like protein